MRSSRGATGLSGILAIDKPAGVTSHDVVDAVRRATGERRIGHAGTLDPMATGLLVVLVGPATRLADYLTAAEKSYQARIVFGTETDTDDAEGRITLTAAVPEEVADPFFAAGTVASLVGFHEQVPPAFSAIKQGGKTAYRAARAGNALELAPRPIQVQGARLMGVSVEPEAAWDVELTVSKGTYVRAIARDLGRALGTAAHLGALRRVRSGALGIDGSHSLDAITSTDDIAALFADPLLALALPVVETTAAEKSRVASGAALPVGPDWDAVPEGTPVAVADRDSLLAVYKRAGQRLVPAAVIPGGVARSNAASGEREDVGAREGNAK